MPPPRSARVARAAPSAERRGPGNPLPTVPLVVAGLTLVFYGLAAWVVPALAVRAAAERAGLQLRFSSAQNLTLDELRVRHVEVVLPGTSVALRASEVRAEVAWRALVSDRPWLGAAHAAGVELSWPGGRVGPLRVELGAPDAAAPSQGARELLIDALVAPLRASSWRSDITLAARSNVRPSRGSARRVELGPGQLEASGVVELAPGELRQPPTPSRTTRVHLLANLASGGVLAAGAHDVRADVEITGDDAALALDLLRADTTVRWMLSELSGQPFVLTGALHVCSAGIDVERVALETGPSRAHGAMHLDTHSARGAFALQRGSLDLGVELTADGVTAEWALRPGWLAAELARLTPRCTTR